MNYLKNAWMLINLTAALAPIQKNRREIRALRAEEERLTAAGASADGAELKALRLREAEQIRLAENRWSDDVLRFFGVSVELEGAENLPEAGPGGDTGSSDGCGFVVVCNHQSNLDIVVLLHIFREFQLGFLAKEELAKIPKYGSWIHDVRSVFLDRGSTRSAIKTLSECEDYIRAGFNMGIFPEGTRAKSSNMGEFKKGSLRVALKTGAVIYPVAIEGSYRAYEEKGKPAPCTVRVRALPPIATAGLSRAEGAELASRVEGLIRSAHDEMMT